MSVVSRYANVAQQYGSPEAFASQDPRLMNQMINELSQSNLAEDQAAYQQLQPYYNPNAGGGGGFVVHQEMKDAMTRQQQAYAPTVTPQPTGNPVYNQANTSMQSNIKQSNVEAVKTVSPLQALTTIAANTSDRAILNEAAKQFYPKDKVVSKIEYNPNSKVFTTHYEAKPVVTPQAQAAPSQDLGQQAKGFAADFASGISKVLTGQRQSLPLSGLSVGDTLTAGERGAIKNVGLATVSVLAIPAGPVVGASSLSVAGGEALGVGVNQAFKAARGGGLLTPEEALQSAAEGGIFTLAGAGVLKGIGSAGKALNIGLPSGKVLAGAGRVGVNTALGGGAGYVLSGGDVEAAKQGALFGAAFGVAGEAAGAVAPRVQAKMRESIPGQKAQSYINQKVYGFNEGKATVNSLNVGEKAMSKILDIKPQKPAVGTTMLPTTPTTTEWTPYKGTKDIARDYSVTNPKTGYQDAFKITDMVEAKFITEGFAPDSGASIKTIRTEPVKKGSTNLTDLDTAHNQITRSNLEVSGVEVGMKPATYLKSKTLEIANAGTGDVYYGKSKSPTEFYPVNSKTGEIVYSLSSGKSSFNKANMKSDLTSNIWSELPQTTLYEAKATKAVQAKSVANAEITSGITRFELDKEFSFKKNPNLMLTSGLAPSEIQTGSLKSQITSYSWRETSKSSSQKLSFSKRGSNFEEIQANIKSGKLKGVDIPQGDITTDLAIIKAEKNVKAQKSYSQNPWQTIDAENALKANILAQPGKGKTVMIQKGGQTSTKSGVTVGDELLSDMYVGRNVYAGNAVGTGKTVVASKGKTVNPFTGYAGKSYYGGRGGQAEEVDPQFLTMPGQVSRLDKTGVSASGTPSFMPSLTGGVAGFDVKPEPASNLDKPINVPIFVPGVTPFVTPDSKPDVTPIEVPSEITVPVQEQPLIPDQGQPQIPDQGQPQDIVQDFWVPTPSKQKGTLGFPNTGFKFEGGGASLGSALRGVRVGSRKKVYPILSGVDVLGLGGKTKRAKKAKKR
ncbi:MAG: hypothetical protein WC325_10900 [Candidatus Bathyarchaeia archaeon]|jgi:hypothetical protein